MPELPYNTRMEDNLKKAFCKAKYEPKENLSSKVWLGVVQHIEHKAKIKFWTFSFFSLASLTGSVFAFRTLSQEFSNSDFSQYFSLVFSNSGIIIKYWKEFILTLTDSVPIVSMVFLLALVFVFFTSLRLTILQFYKSRLSVSF
jgi:hypothetical protein